MRVRAVSRAKSRIDQSKQTKLAKGPFKMLYRPVNNLKNFVPANKMKSLRYFKICRIAFHRPAWDLVKPAKNIRCVFNTFLEYFTRDILFVNSIVLLW